MSYKDYFKIDLDRFAEVITEMKPIYEKNEHLYKEKFLFPEFRFSHYFHKPEHKDHLAQLFFWASYTDHNKLSEHHYKRDVALLDRLMKTNTLETYITNMIQQRHGMTGFNDEYEELLQNTVLTTRKTTTHQNLTGQLYSFSPIEQTVFLKKVINNMALHELTYLQKIQTNNKKNNPLNVFQNALHKLVDEYDANPLHIAKDKTPKEFVDAVIEIPGFDFNLAYILVSFYAESGLTPYSIYELEGVDPKIDRNDIVVAQMTDILHIEKRVRKEPVVYALSKAMTEAADMIGVTAVEVDLYFWAAAQAYQYRFPSELSPATPFFTPEELSNFSITYYKDGFIDLKNRQKQSKSPLETEKQAPFSSKQLNLFSE